MLVGERLKAIRETKNFSQGDIEKRTGLLRCYTSRVENGHTVPSIETLEKYARALEIPLYQLFYEGDKEPQGLNLPVPKTVKLSSKDTQMLSRMGALFGRMKERDKKLLLSVAIKMSASR